VLPSIPPSVAAVNEGPPHAARRKLPVIAHADDGNSLYGKLIVPSYKPKRRLGIT
jgi:hypothetical protein